jgi:SAM-dependent methyltransferase
VSSEVDARSEDRYQGFPDGFFARMDEAPDHRFYAMPRLVTHIDDGAIAAVGQLYRELDLAAGETLDLMSSWVSHHPVRPRRLVALGMSAVELERNPQADEYVVHDLNAEPRLPFPDASFDSVTCCVSIDYLTRPLEVFDEVARVLRPGGPLVCTFSNRCFPTKAIRGWLATDDATHCRVVAEYFRRSTMAGGPGPGREAAWEPPVAEHRNAGRSGDPLFAVWARRRPPA